MTGEEGLKVNLHQLFCAMIEKGASDMHITTVVGGFSPAPAGVPPFGDREARNPAPHPRVWGPGPKREPSR
jgi:hypothetical protein